MPRKLSLLVLLVFLCVSCSGSGPQPDVTAPQPAAVQLSSEAGSSATAAFTFSNQGDRALTFELSSRDTWLTVLPVSGTLQPGESLTARLEADCADVSNSRTGAASISTNDPATPLATVSVTLLCGASVDAAGYDISVRFSGDGFTAAREDVFLRAAARWSALIEQDLAAVSVNKDANSCGPAFTGEVDDLLIYAVIKEIDGPGGILGQAGPCYIRARGARLPVFGIMEFDSADVDKLEAQGQFERVILHEMGHVLGIGTLWDAPRQGHALLDYQGSGDDCASSTSFSTKPSFNGSAALREYKALGGDSQAPVEDEFGQGTKCGHWDEDHFSEELMTGFLNAGPVPLSRLTVASLADLGYSVDYSSAENYRLQDCPPDCLLPQAGGVQLREVLIRPQAMISPEGRVIELER